MAEAYVYEAERIKLKSIEEALKNTTKQLKELTTGEIDLSLSPSLTRLLSQIDTALTAIKTAHEHLHKMEPQGAAASIEESSTILEDSGTTLTPSQLSTISELASTATSEANELSTLVQETKLEPIEIAVIESQARVLATRLAVLSIEVEAVRQAETDPQVYSELLYVEELVRVASATGEAALGQVVPFYATQQNDDLLVLVYWRSSPGIPITHCTRRSNYGLHYVAFPP